MHNDPVIDSLETLCADAKIRMVTAQGQSLVLAYMRALLRRRDTRVMILEEIRDENAIALALRRPPIFGFVSNDWCEAKSALTLNLNEANSELAQNLSHAVVRLSGEHKSTYTLHGELGFGAQAACHVVCVSQKVGDIPMVDNF